MTVGLPAESERGSLPSWAVDLDRALPVQSQFVISGNIRDVYPVTLNGSQGFKPVLDVCWDVLSARGCEFMLVYDPVDNLHIHALDQVDAAARVAGLKLDENGKAHVSLDQLAKTLRLLGRSRDVPAAVVIDYASRIAARSQELDAEQHAFFVSCEKLAHQARQLRSRATSNLPFNPIIWLINGPNDLPTWLTVGNETFRSIVASLPDREARRKVADVSAAHFPDSATIDEGRQQELVRQFVLQTEGMTVRSLLSIIELARDPRFGLERIVDAVRAYKVGAPDDPWKQPLVRQQIRSGSEMIGERVKGQPAAINKALDILTRSVMGLSGAQAGRTGGRPRGVLFFAGPTGVGKTELAKTITQLLFGDESAYHRFDMSEFSAEHAEARLIGAPPGYVGHDAGGELVNAVRQRPFCVLLFDEVEKAHPRILDKFLQILEDGRLTDGRGETVFFSEAVIIFTSNLGIYVKDRDGTRRANVSQSDDYGRVNAQVTEAIRNYFRFEIQRPELLNRIGDNIVVFDFIRHDVARDILSKMIANVTRRVEEEHGVNVRLSAKARAVLDAKCFHNLENGGRGIGNQLESYFINPLARVLFAGVISGGETMTIENVVEQDGQWELIVA